jgi:hypothetical protein
MVSEKYHDFAALAVSITDIVLDVLVMLEFRAQGLVTHFVLSLSCFALAQTSYSLLFVQRWISDASFRNLRFAQAVGFVLVWPFAQLIPVLICLEAQGFECVTRFLKCLHLKPRTRKDAHDNSLWGKLSRRWSAHAGFFLEALVEAVPQSAIQVHAALLRPPSVIDTLSIIMSLVVIVSKAHFVAFSPDPKTFAFHAWCLAADVFGLFAAVAWLRDGVGVTLAYGVVVAGLGSLFMAGWSVVLFANFDDHLKQQRSADHDGRKCVRTEVWWDIYVIRTLFWLVATVPITVVTSSVRILPLAWHFLRTGPPVDVAQRSVLFQTVVAWLRAGEAEVKVRMLNNTLDGIEELFRSSNPMPPSTDEQAFAAWLSTAGTERPANRGRPTSFQNPRMASSPIYSHDALAAPEEPPESRRRCCAKRRARAQSFCLKHGKEMRSEVLLHLGGESLYPTTKDSIMVKLIRFAGLLALLSVIFWGALAAAILPFFLLTGPALVVVNAPSCGFGVHPDMAFTPVPCALSACTLGCGLAGLVSLRGVIAFSRLLPMIPKERLQFSRARSHLQAVTSSGLVVRETAKRMATQRILARHLGSGPGYEVFSYLYFPEAAPVYGSSSREGGGFREYFRRNGRTSPI